MQRERRIIRDRERRNVEEREILNREVPVNVQDMRFIRLSTGIISDNLRDYFLNANYGDTDVLERIEPFLNQSIFSALVATTLMALIIQINELYSETNNMRFHYNDNMLNYFGPGTNMHLIVNEVDYTPNDSDRSFFDTEMETSSRRLNVPNFIYYDENLPDDNWGLLIERVFVLTNKFIIPFRRVPSNLRVEVSDNTIVEFNELNTYLKSVAIFMRERNLLRENMPFNQREIRRISIVIMERERIRREIRLRDRSNRGEVNTEEDEDEEEIETPNENIFFIQSNNRFCKNNESPAYWLDTNDSNNFIISYGKNTEYMCYTLQELIDGFKPYGDNGNFYNYRIYDESGTFRDLPVEEALQLYSLIRDNLPDLKSEILVQAQELLNSIQNIKDVVKGTTDYERSIFEEYLKFSDPIREAIQDYLKQLFYVGMYMRRWKGPGFSYPLLEEETTRNWGTNGPEENVRPKLDKLADLMMNIKVLSEEASIFVENLREVQHFEGKIRVSRDVFHDLKHLLDITIKGNYCIRMASTFFIGTGAHYIKLFENYDFEGYDVKLIARIT